METWIDIPGFEGKYMISNLCRIKSLSRPVRTMNTTRIITERILKPGKASNGYYTVNMGKRSHLIHRLIAHAFIPNPDNLSQVNHKNGIRTDNRIENLEWVSCRENAAHRQKRTLPHGVYPTVSGSYLVQVHYNGKNNHIGYCYSVAEAVFVRDSAMLKLKIKNRYHHV